MGGLVGLAAPSLLESIAADERAAHVTAIDRQIGVRNQPLGVLTRLQSARGNCAAAKHWHGALRHRSQSTRIGNLFGERAGHDEVGQFAQPPLRVSGVIGEEEAGLINSHSLLAGGEAVHSTGHHLARGLDHSLLPVETKLCLLPKVEPFEVLDPRAEIGEVEDNDAHHAEAPDQSSCELNPGLLAPLAAGSHEEEILKESGRGCPLSFKAMPLHTIPACDAR